MKLEFKKGVTPPIRKYAQDFIKKAYKVFKWAHPVKILIVPAPVVTDNYGNYGFGAFLYNGDDLTIILAGEVLPDMNYSEWLSLFKESFCHEFAHYEQYRDGKPLQERGVAIRARNLMEILNK